MKIKYLLSGILFGIILYKAEVISWFRIQEMFRFQSFHMYGIIGSAIATGLLSIQILKKLKIKSFGGMKLSFESKTLTKGTVIGGLMFGFGWAFTGACPGPLFALVGSGFYIMIVPLICAILGAYSYGLLKNKLPH